MVRTKSIPVKSVLTVNWSDGSASIHLNGVKTMNIQGEMFFETPRG